MKAPRASSRLLPPSVGVATADALILVSASAAALGPVVRNAFVNWDDPTVLIENTRLREAGLAPWAFTTTLIGHFQPLAWLGWGALARTAGVTPEPFHAASLVLHIVNGALVYGLGGAMAQRAGASAAAARATALGAALLFLVHPVAVEPVAWASAFPYVAALASLLCATLAYLGNRRGLALAGYAVSLATRPIALAYPVVLLALDWWPLNRSHTPIKRLILEKTPFVGLSVAAAALEWRARDVAGFADVGPGARLTDAASAPALYALRFLWPARLSPLDVLPIAPEVRWGALIAGLGAVALVTATVWAVRGRSMAPAAAWVTYLALLAPVAGLIPSGLQATADRYLYAPSVVGAIALAATGVRLGSSSARRAAIAGATAIAVLVALGAVARQQVGYWHDSITLWSRAVQLDPRNDAALYNLAVAFAEQGRENEAITTYEETLALVPDHELARGELARLKGRRLRERTARGKALVQQGRFAEGAAELKRAVDEGARDGETANVLAYALLQNREGAQAAAVLARAASDHPDDINVKHNLARLLATADDPAVRNPQRGLRLAQEVCAATGNRDPRALDTLALAYAASGDPNAARAAALRGAAIARKLGDSETAAAIDAHAAQFGR